jgi:DNA repair protein RecO
MFRSITTEAIVIRRDRMGEYHKNLHLLTSDLGLITAAAYGAFKMQSRIRMASEPFIYSRAVLYHNPVKRSYKITDLEVRESFDRLHRDLPRLSAASLWAEVVLKSYGAGETSNTLFRLFIGCLRLLDASSPEEEPYVTDQFLWRFLALSGYQPDISTCDKCGKRFSAEDPAFYESSANALLCRSCSLSTSLPLTAGALRFLQATEALPLEQAMKIRLDLQSLKHLQEFLFQAIRAVLEGEPKSLRFLGASR